MRKCINTVDKLIFSETGPFNLGFCRFLYFSFQLFCYVILREQDFTLWSTLPKEFWLPSTELRFFFSEPISYELIKNIEIVWLVSCLFSALGFLTRPALIISFITGWILVQNRLSYGDFSHEVQTIFWGHFIFMLSRCGDAFSLDQFFLKKERRSSAAYNWPIIAMQFVWAVIFFFSGVAKLKNSGLEFFMGDNIKNILIHSHYVSYIDEYAQNLGLGIFLSNFPLACQILGFCSVIVELTAPLIFIFRRYAWVFILNILLMQIFIRLAVTTGFTWFYSYYFFFVPWEKSWTFVKGRLGISKK